MVHIYIYCHAEIHQIQFLNCAHRFPVVGFIVGHRYFRK